MDSDRVRPGEPLDMTADLAGIIQGLGLERPIVGGHSMGAMVAYELGVRYPELVRALVLEDPPWWMPDESEIRPTDANDEHPMAEFMRYITSHSMQEILAQCQSEHPNWPEIVKFTWSSAKKRLDPDILSILHLEGTDWPDTVAKIACPTLVFTADVDKGADRHARSGGQGERIEPPDHLCPHPRGWASYPFRELPGLHAGFPLVSEQDMSYLLAQF